MFCLLRDESCHLGCRPTLLFTTSKDALLTWLSIIQPFHVAFGVHRLLCTQLRYVCVCIIRSVGTRSPARVTNHTRVVIAYVCNIHVTR